jgi:hypothetical protein
MRTAITLLAVSFAGIVSAVLPPPTDEAKAKSAETAAKAAWEDKVGLYKLCMAMDRTADAYRKDRQASGEMTAPPVATPACVDPGPYVSQLTPSASKPQEASGAHSPPGTAVSPPSTNVPQRVSAIAP